MVDGLLSSDAVTMGFLMRSDVVAGWPGILIDGLVGKSPQQPPIIPIRRQLASNVLLCLFKTEVTQIAFHQKPEVAHFGVMQDNDTFQKRSRDNEGNEVGDPIDVKWKEHPTSRVIAMDQICLLYTSDAADE